MKEKNDVEVQQLQVCLKNTKHSQAALSLGKLGGDSANGLGNYSKDMEDYSKNGLEQCNGVWQSGCEPCNGDGQSGMMAGAERTGEMCQGTEPLKKLDAVELLAEPGGKCRGNTEPLEKMDGLELAVESGGMCSGNTEPLAIESVMVQQQPPPCGFLGFIWFT